MTDDPMALARAMVAENAAHMKATTKRGDWITWSGWAHLVMAVHPEYVEAAVVAPGDEPPYEVGAFTWEVVEPLGDVELDDDDREMERLIMGGEAQP